MKLQALNNEKLNDFFTYCKKHKLEIDDSFLYDDDLKDFLPNEDNPTCIITNDQDQIVATASLILNEYHRKGRKGRFRIFHCEVEGEKYYQEMLNFILKHTTDIDNIFIFIPMTNKYLISAIEALDFAIERYSFLLTKEAKELPSFELPEGYKLINFRKGQDEEAWCKVRNISFANLKGSETPITPEMITKMMQDSDNLEGGSMLLYHGEEAVGVVRGTDDEYEGVSTMTIGPLAIIPEYQGKGLGRMLLRSSMQFAKNKGYKKICLCVNAENERAKALYIQEGFSEAEAVVCYKYSL